ncbi:MAG: DUF3575 domain-containing protein [Tannerella sp.]|jgi:long-subunit fatty acid transport protein|nr:DUF3575 domain-containing protein [Tannerella sp.]
MKRWILLIGIYLLCQNGYSQNFGIKSNLLYDATSTINLGIEYALSDKLTLDVSVNINPWAFPQRKVDTSGSLLEQYDAILKHWILQPELRWWKCEKFNGHFFGAYATGGQFNVGGLSFLPEGWGKRGLQINRFEGWLAGTGLSYGYHYILSDRFSLEFSLGLGYTFLKYNKFNNYASSEPTTKDRMKYRMHYFGPTKAGISVVFMLY